MYCVMGLMGGRVWRSECNQDQSGTTQYLHHFLVTLLTMFFLLFSMKVYATAWDTGIA